MSWGRSHAHHCELIHGYPQAQRHFDSRGAVRSKHWARNERPLIRTRENWFKLVRGPDVSEQQPDALYYDVECYAKTALRYFRPQLDGGYTVLVRDRRIGRTSEVIARMGWATWSNVVPVAGGGDPVLVPLKRGGHGDDLVSLDGWSAKLVFNAADELLLTQSDHHQPHTRVSTKEDTLLRKRAHARLATVIDLILLRIPAFHADSVVSGNRGQAFGGFQGRVNAELLATVKALAVYTNAVVPEHLWAGLLPFCQEVYNVALSKKKMAAGDALQWSAAKSGADEPPLEQAAFKTALKAALIRHAGLDKQNGQALLPKFPTSLPKKYWF